MPYQLRRIGIERIFVQHWLARYESALLLVGLATALAVGIERTVQHDTLHLLSVLSSVGAAIVAGFGPAIRSALACFFSLNFFFIEPRYSFIVGQPEDLPQLAEYRSLAMLLMDILGTMKERCHAINRDQVTHSPIDTGWWTHHPCWDRRIPPLTDTARSPVSTTRSHSVVHGLGCRTPVCESLFWSVDPWPNDL